MSAACVARGSASGGPRTGTCIQAYLSEIFARCARSQILNQIWRNPELGQGGVLLGVLSWSKMGHEVEEVTNSKVSPVYSLATPPRGRVPYPTLSLTQLGHVACACLSARPAPGGRWRLWA